MRSWISAATDDDIVDLSVGRGSNERVIEALERRMKGTYRHHRRPSSEHLRNSDKIFLIKDCGVAEDGTDERPLKSDGSYAHLASSIGEAGISRRT